MDVIVVDKLTKRYGRRTGVDALSLRVPEGLIYGFLGPNGAGKTTTIRVLLGLLTPTAGGARIFERDCWRDTRHIKAEVGYLPGDLRLYSWLNCREALTLIGRIRGRNIATEGSRLAEEFALDPIVRVRAMSRGMRQKLGLILALAHRPRLLILDEPTASLDPLMQEKLYRHLRAVAASGRTVFLSSHTLSEVEQLCDRVAILREGRLMAEDSLQQMRARAPRRVFIRWAAAGTAPEGAPASLHVTSRTDGQWHGVLSGPSMELVQWAARAPIADLSIEQPDLTHLFQQFYQ